MTDLLQHVQDVHVGLRVIWALRASVDGVQALARTAPYELHSLGTLD